MGFEDLQLNKAEVPEHLRKDFLQSREVTLHDERTKENTRGQLQTVEAKEETKTPDNKMQGVVDIARKKRLEEMAKKFVMNKYYPEMVEAKEGPKKGEIIKVGDERMVERAAFSSMVEELKAEDQAENNENGIKWQTLEESTLTQDIIKKVVDKYLRAFRSTSTDKNINIKKARAELRNLLLTPAVEKPIEEPIEEQFKEAA